MASEGSAMTAELKQNAATGAPARSWKPYPAYKDSGVEWTGEIPDTWNTIQIKRLSQVKRGASPRPINDPKYFDDNGEFAWVRISDVSASNKYLENTTQKLSNIGVSLSVKQYPGDIFLSIAGTVGKPIISKIKCCIHDGFVWFPNLKINPEFLYYIFSTGEPYYGLGKWGTQLNLNTETVGYISIPLPSNELEINTIVKYLNDRTRKIDSLIEKKQKMIELLKEERTATINQAVTKGLNPDVPMKDSGIEWLGEVPEHWEVKMVKRLCLIKRGASPRPIDNPIYFDEDGEYSWVRISDVTASTKYLQSTYQKLSTLGKSKSVPLEPGELFLSIAGSVGKPIITAIKCCIHDGFVYFVGLKQNREYLFYLFSGGELYKGLGKVGTQLNLNTDTVGEMKIPVPPLSEQCAITKYIETSIKKIDTTISRIEKEIEFLQEYRTALISEVVTGKIDVREAI